MRHISIDPIETLLQNKCVEHIIEPQMLRRQFSHSLNLEIVWLCTARFGKFEQQLFALFLLIVLLAQYNTHSLVVSKTLLLL